MREDCRHFESRTYEGGEVARFCVLDLAPEAPWRCPENCPSYERSVIDPTFETAALGRSPRDAAVNRDAQLPTRNTRNGRGCRQTPGQHSSNSRQSDSSHSACRR